MKIEVGKLYDEVYFCIRTGANTKFPTLQMGETYVFLLRPKRKMETNYSRVWIGYTSKDIHSRRGLEGCSDIFAGRDKIIRESC